MTSGVPPSQESIMAKALGEHVFAVALGLSITVASAKAAEPIKLGAIYSLEGTYAVTEAPAQSRHFSRAPRAAEPCSRSDEVFFGDRIERLGLRTRCRSPARPRAYPRQGRLSFGTDSRTLPCAHSDAFKQVDVEADLGSRHKPVLNAGTVHATEVGGELAVPAPREHTSFSQGSRLASYGRHLCLSGTASGQLNGGGSPWFPP
jgi:hypothetical protein